MKVFSRFVKATVVGGLLFMVPLILMVVVLQKGLGLVSKIVLPLAKQFPDHKVLGVGITTILSIAAILILSFLFGLAARTRTGRKVREWLEYTVLGGVPGYTFVKGMIQGATGLENEDEAKVALIRIEDAWQIGLIVEAHADGHLTVYVPGAPNPASGSVYFMTADRVRMLDLKMGQVLNLVRRLGLGSEEVLKGKLDEPSRT